MGFFTSKSKSAPVKDVTVEELQSLLSGGTAPVVIDVRTAPELTAELGALEGIVHIPLHELPRSTASLAERGDRELYIICRSGNRSAHAAAFLREQGFSAHNVIGGMIAWRRRYGPANK